MQPDEVATLFAYNRWAKQRIWNAAAGLTADVYTATPLPELGSLQQILVHAYGADWLWHRRMADAVSPTALPPVEAYPTFESLRAAWMDEQESMQAYVEGLTEADLAQDRAYTTTGGSPQHAPLWQVLLHLLFHGTQHMAEAAAILTALGRSPGNIDFIYYVREQQAQGAA